MFISLILVEASYISCRCSYIPRIRIRHDSVPIPYFDRHNDHCGCPAPCSACACVEEPDDALLPDFGNAPLVNFEVAVAVVEQAIEEGSAGVDWNKDEVREKARAKQWKPMYKEDLYDTSGQR